MTKESKTQHAPIKPDDFGIPYFQALIRGNREYGICPACGEEVLRAKSSFGRHWEDAVKYEAAH